ncbi:thiamine-binding protein [Janibacter sp. GS2]|uniref:thiamine-binding protein n=1 Tax=Janibacter sp. GS2 TaxID=3442646 RepID=UPI003EB96E48
MLLAFSIAPAGPGDDDSYAPAVAAALQVVRDSGLPHDLGSMFTTIEGDWDEVMSVVKRCVDAMEPYGDRVGLVMKADIRAGRTDQITTKVQRVEGLLDGTSSS